MLVTPVVGRRPGHPLGQRRVFRSARARAERVRILEANEFPHASVDLSWKFGDQRLQGELKRLLLLLVYFSRSGTKDAPALVPASRLILELGGYGPDDQPILTWDLVAREIFLLIGCGELLRCESAFAKERSVAGSYWMPCYSLPEFGGAVVVLLVEEISMGSSVVKFHRNERSSAISTNATTEDEFLREVVPALTGQIGLQGNSEGVVALLATAVPQIVDIVCKLRGYKANVSEHRVIVAGDWLPDDVVNAFSAPEAQ